MNAWVPLVNTSKDGGTLAIIPRSHQKGALPHKFYEGPNKWGHGIYEEYINSDLIKYIEINSGSLVLFHSLLFHGTSPNLDGKNTRWVSVVRYNNPTSAPYLSDDNSPLRIEQKD